MCFHPCASEMSGGAAAALLGLGAGGCSLMPSPAWRMRPSERRRRGSEPGPAGNEPRLPPAHARGQGGADCAKPSSGTPHDMVEEALQASSGRRRAIEQGVLLRPMYKVTAIRARCLDALLLPIALGGAPLRDWMCLSSRRLSPGASDHGAPEWVA